MRTEIEILSPDYNVGAWVVFLGHGQQLHDP